MSLSIIHARRCQQDQQGKVARSVRTGRPLVWQEYLMNTSTERAFAFLRTMKVMFVLSAGLVASLNVSRMGSVCDHSCW